MYIHSVIPATKIDRVKLSNEIRKPKAKIVDKTIL